MSWAEHPHNGPWDFTTVAYDMRDGSSRWTVDGSWPVAIADDVVLFAETHTTLIACPQDEDLLTFQVADGRIQAIDAEVGVGRVEAVWEDRIFVSYGATRHSVDRAGSLVGEKLPGELVARADDTLLFHAEGAESDMPTLVAYRLRQ